MVQSITLQNVADTAIVNNDILGQICFAAPNEASVTGDPATGDSILISASIFARSEGTFAVDNNATELVFVTAVSESAAPGATNYDMTLSSTGTLSLAGGLVIADGGNIGSASDSDALTISSGGLVTFSQGFAVGSDASGDILYHNGTSYVRLAKGSDDEVLTLASGLPSWAEGGGSARSVAGTTDNGIITFVNSGSTFAAEANFQMDGTDLLLTSATGSKPVFTIQNTNNGATSGYLKFVNDKGGAGADNDVAGTITFYNDDDAQTNMEFARIEGYVVDATNGTERGGLKLYAAEFDGTVTAGLTLAGGAENDGLTLTTNSGIVRKVANKVDINYTMTATDHIVLVDTGADDRTITLPTASADNIGQEYTIKKTDPGAGVVNITPASTGGYGPDDIDEYDTKFVLYAQHDSVTFVCGEGDTTAGNEQWWVIAQKLKPHVAKVYSDAAQTGVTTSAWDQITFDTSEHLVGLTWTDANDKITITRPGYYHIHAQMSLDLNANDNCYLAIGKNGATSGAVDDEDLLNVTANSRPDANIYQECSVVDFLAVGDYITLHVWHDKGTTASTLVSGGAAGGDDLRTKPRLIVHEIIG